MENIGVFKDSFNPIHLGHLSFLKIIKKRYNLNKIFLIIKNNNKKIKNLASNSDRINMCKLATKNYEFIEIYNKNLLPNGPTYILDIVKDIAQNNKNSSLFLILHPNSLSSFEKLYKYKEIIKIAKVVSCAPGPLCNLFKKNDTVSKNISIVSHSLPQIYGAKLKIKLAQNKDCSKWLDPFIYNYIKSNKLYMGKNCLFLECYAACKKHTSKKRFHHCVCVSKAAEKLALIHDENEQDAKIAGLLHDIMKEKTEEYMLNLFKIYNITLSSMQKINPKIWHGLAGALYVENILGIENTKIINGIKYHTIPRKNMTKFEKIIFIADSTSQDRKYKDLKHQRKLAKKDLDTAILYRLKYSLISLIKNQTPVYYSTLECYNDIIINKKLGERKNNGN